ncbi:MAG: hypothetical protein WAW53_12035 [Candidatus Dormiibacterota bacterium]
MCREVGLDTDSISRAIRERFNQHLARHHLCADSNAVSSGTVGLPTTFVDLCGPDRWLGHRHGRVRKVLRVDLPHDEWWRDLDTKRCSASLLPYHWLL